MIASSCCPSSLLAELPCSTMGPTAHASPWKHVGPAGYAMYDDALKLGELESAGAAQAMVQINGSSAWLLATANGGNLEDGRPARLSY